MTKPGILQTSIVQADLNTSLSPPSVFREGLGYDLQQNTWYSSRTFPYLLTGQTDPRMFWRVTGKNLEKVYTRVEDIDPFSGELSEHPVSL